MVYWTGSNVTVWERDDQGRDTATTLDGLRDGQGVVPEGVSLYITKGKVKEKF